MDNVFYFATVNILIQPTTVKPSYKAVGINKSLSEIELSNKGYWFEDRQNRLALKSIIDFIESYPNQAHCSIKMDSQNHIQLLVKRLDKDEYIYFPSKFPQVAPEIQLNVHGNPIPTNYEWDYKGDIFDAFVNCYKSIYNYDGR